MDGVLLEDNLDQFDLQVFQGLPGINAAAATEEEWKTLHKFKQTILGGHRWITFDPQQTCAVRLHITKTHQGSGLGLAIAKSLITLHGGTMRIRSTPGRGTMVLLRLPAMARPGVPEEWRKAG